MTRPTIGLLLEGTYPFVQGGVSGWVHQLIQGLADYFDFRLTYIGSHPQEHPDFQYDLPSNVLSLDCFYLFDETSDYRYNPKTKKKVFIAKSARWRPQHSPKEPTRMGAAWATQLLSRLQSKTPLSTSLLKGLMASPGSSKSPFYPKSFRKLVFSQSHFLNSKAAWRKIHKDYKKLNSDGPFNHFFWHYQGLYRQVFRLAEIAQHVQAADCYHSISTGYAGFLGAILAAASQRPFIVTEHGIYTRERRIDLNEASWLSAQPNQRSIFHEPTDHLMRKLWIRFFEQISLTTYAHASQITTLYESNRQFQIKEGAPAEKTAVIRNGINLKQFRSQPETASRARNGDGKHRIALIGRVVSIKDVTTFIKSISLLTTKYPNVEVLIVGPCNEQPDYVAQCRVLIDLLNLNDTITLTGSQEISSLLPTLDAVVLTSISEAQPLILLEAMACRVPVVATNVGACREIIEGFDPKHPKPCGIVVPVTAPDATARAIGRLLGNAHLREKLGNTGRQRVEQYYSDKSMLAAYARTYLSALPKPRLKPVKRHESKLPLATTAVSTGAPKKELIEQAATQTKSKKKAAKQSTFMTILRKKSPKKSALKKSKLNQKQMATLSKRGAEVKTAGATQPTAIARQRQRYATSAGNKHHS